MSEILNNLLIKAYRRYKDDPDPPVPLDTIKKFLEFEGVQLDDKYNAKR